MQLDERIRSHIDEACPALTLDDIIGTDDAVNRASITRLEPTSIFRKPVRLALAAAAVAVVCVGLAVALIGRDSGSVLASGSEFQHLPDLPATVDGWERLVDPLPRVDSESALLVHDALTVGDTLFAVGAEWKIIAGEGNFDARKIGAIWSSKDGLTWERAEGDFGSFDEPAGYFAPSGIALEHVISHGGEVFAFGNEYREGATPVGYRSANGRDWTQLRLPPGDSSEAMQLVSVTSTPDLVFALFVDALGNIQKPARIAFSDDKGATWNSHIIDLGTADISLPLDIAALDGRIILVGEIVQTGAPAGEAQRIAAAWYSDDDGRSWASSIFASVEPGSWPGSSIQIVVAGPDGMMASGDQNTDEASTTLEPDDGHGGIPLDLLDVAFWSSIDGETWVLRDSEPSPGKLEFTGNLIAHDAGVLALVGWNSDSDEGSSATGASVEGDRIPLPASSAQALTSIDGRTVLIGRPPVSQVGGESDADDSVAIWVAG